VSNYAVSGSHPGRQVAADQRSVFLTTEDGPRDGSTCVLTVSHVRNLAQGVEMTNPVSRTFTYQALLMTDDFADNDMSGWTIMDEVSRMAIELDRKERTTVPARQHLLTPRYRHGSSQSTFAYWNDSKAFLWTNYSVSVSCRNSDDDGLGVLFRYQNRPTTISSSWIPAQLPQALQNGRGVESVLATETAGYVPSLNFRLRVELTNNSITLKMDDTILFGGPVTDATLRTARWRFTPGLAGLSFSNLT